ncbi:hypothetical protein [Clavibacter californiensis]|uniref:Uncharacterized protein n=1 Tax=Clavibacter californiensis TaxID=1401995 RepID=A0ABX9NAC5_9MICO|nr:hypothetical protein [Clavibacter californiensis]RII94562.1 hypothetical protein DZF98_01195 [Clavibacter californiensis]UKF78900.1 hypothetical protein FGD68_08750 [Clavibacter californiensis]
MSDDTPTEPDHLSLLQGTDGELSVQAEGHVERVKALTAQLIVIGPDEAAYAAVRAAVRDPALEREYAKSVAIEAVELAARYTIREMPIALVPVFTTRMHRLIMATRM